MKKIQAILIGTGLTALASQAMAATTTTTIAVTATVTSSCIVAALPVVFGNYDPTSATDKISAPTTGTRITTVSQARGELQELLDGFPSATYRVELLVWEGSFAQAKMVEQALLEMGYDSNPIPLRSGQAIAPGVGGVQ